MVEIFLEHIPLQRALYWPIKNELAACHYFKPTGSFVGLLLFTLNTWQLRTLLHVKLNLSNHNQYHSNYV